MDGVFLRATTWLRSQPRGQWALLGVMSALLVLSTADRAAAHGGNGSGGGSRTPKSTNRAQPLRRTHAPPVDIADESNPLAQPLTDIRVEGNTTIPEYVIIQKVTTRPGRAASQAQITEDVRSLYDTRWFTSVAPVYQQTDDGLVLVFRVIEKPVVRSVKFSGNRKIKTKKLEAETGLRQGAPFDVTINQEAVQRIRELYVEKGYRNVEVDLKNGGDPNDRDVLFVIREGAKVRVRHVSIAGNEFTRDGVLKLGKETKARWWFPLHFVGGKYDPETIPNDEIALTQYYQGLGFFDVEVKPALHWVNQDKSLVDVVFNVKEGRRYKIRNVEVNGEQVVAERDLRKPLKLVKGEFFNARHLGTDVTSMKSNYDELGRMFASVNAQPVFLEEPGYIDLVYAIDEDKVYYIGDIHIGIRGDHPHTTEDVIRNQVDAYIQPGSLANAANIRKMQSRLLGSHLWERSDPATVNIRKVEGSDYLALDIIGRAQSRTRPNTQQPNVDALVRSLKPISVGHSVASPKRKVTPAKGGDSTKPRNIFLQHVPATGAQPAKSPVAQPPVRQRTGRDDVLERGDDVVMWEMSPPSLVIRAQSDDIIRSQSPDYRGQSMDSFGNPVPQDYLQGVSPQGDPYGNGLRGPILPGFVDVDIDVTEARTGRLMFGLGVNSDAGVVGNIVLEENNFDIMRAPRSFADIVNGQAWRGGGQSFRIEAVPGNQVSRYLMSWQDPFFLNTDFNLGVSGFYYTRFFDNWNEQRLGGRVTLGKLLGNFWSASGALRLEEVRIDNVRAGAPPILASVVGDSFLSTGRFAIAHDTRDSSFLPTQGHSVEGSVEQAFGDYSYSRFELTGSQFFTVYERPDGRGKHILQLRGQVGWTGDETPIFERFFAGGFQSFRGFEFRGVTPRIGFVKTGGQFMLLGTAEYIIPVTANDNIRAVVFSDFGTVEETAGIDQFRASVGAGLRLIVPAMGPAPIALDFAFPLVKEDFDERQVFSFYIGFTR